MGMQVSEGLAASLSMTAIMSTLIREFGDQAVTYQVSKSIDYLVVVNV